MRNYKKLREWLIKEKENANDICTKAYKEGDSELLNKNEARYKAFLEVLNRTDEIFEISVKPDVSGQVCECGKPNSKADREHGLKLCLNCRKLDSQTLH